MRKLFLLITTFLAVFSPEAQAGMQQIYLCENMKSFYFSDPVLARALVINYHAQSGELSFLRCGLSDRPRKAALRSTPHAYPCGIYRRTTVQSLCNEEVQYKSARRLPTELGEVATTTVLTGGIGLFGAASRTYSVAKSELKPTCEATQLVVAFLNGQKIRQRLTEFENAQTKLQPFKEWAALAKMLKIPHLRLSEGYVFDRLDNFINPNYNGPVRLENNLAYLYNYRDNRMTDRLDFDNGAIPALCNALGN